MLLKTPAVVRTMENSSAVIHARKGAEAEFSAVQRTEATFESDSDEARVRECGAVLPLIGDERRDNSETRKLKVVREVHSPSKKT